MIETSWPEWAREQLLSAVALASSAPSARPLATDLYERWFAGVSGRAAPRPLLGEYRRAHRDTAVRVVDGIRVLDHRDAIKDGWWRTWNTEWRPPRTGSRVVLSPHPERAAELVARLTWALREVPYLLSAPIEPARLAAHGAGVLRLARRSSLTPELLREIGPCLRPDSPPLCLPVAPGVALAESPHNGMTFGEHRCRLVAMALQSAAAGNALRAIADVFSAHGVDPSAPHRSAPMR